MATKEEKIRELVVAAFMVMNHDAQSYPDSPDHEDYEASKTTADSLEKKFKKILGWK